MSLAGEHEELTIESRITAPALSVLCVTQKIRSTLFCSVQRKWSHLSRKTPNSLFVVWCLTLKNQRLVVEVTPWKLRFHQQLFLHSSHWSKSLYFFVVQSVSGLLLFARRHRFVSGRANEEEEKVERVKKKEEGRKRWREATNPTPLPLRPLRFHLVLSRSSSRGQTRHCSRASSVRIGHLPFYWKNRKRLGKIWWRRIANGNQSDISAGKFGLSFKTFRLFRKFPVGRGKIVALGFSSNSHNSTITNIWRSLRRIFTFI